MKRVYQRNSEDNDLFLAWLPAPVRELIVNRAPGWQFERGRWYGFFTRTGAHRDARAARARGEMFLFDPERHVPRWITPVPPAPRSVPHDRELGQNPGDEGLRRVERAAAASGSTEDRIRLARERKRRGGAVEDWELVPVAYVFMEAFDDLARYYKPGGLRSGSAVPKVEGRVEAYRGVAFKPWVMHGGYPDKPERFYVVPAAYPTYRPGFPQFSGEASSREEEVAGHLAAIEEWRGRGAIVVRLAFGGRAEHAEVCGKGGHDDGKGGCSYCTWLEAYRWRVLTHVEDVRNALSQSGWWSSGTRDVLLPRQWEWARIMRRVGKRWKNNPRELRIPAPGFLYPATEFMLPLEARNWRSNPVLSCEGPYCACLGEGHDCAGCGARSPQGCSCKRCERCRTLVRGRPGGAPVVVTEDDEILCEECYA